jgi:hypothetical protein
MQVPKLGLNFQALKVPTYLSSKPSSNSATLPVPVVVVVVPHKSEGPTHPTTHLSIFL